MSYACATPQSERGSARVMGLVLGGVLVLLSSGVGVAAERPLPVAKPEKFDLSAEQLARIDDVVNNAIKKGELPGAVVVIVHRGHIIFRKAYGHCSKAAAPSAMTPEIVFDLASLTKPIATATAVLLLIEQGKLRPEDRLARHLPAFARKETDGIT